MKQVRLWLSENGFATALVLHTALLVSLLVFWFWLMR